jgi:O-antigen ligase
MVDESSRSQWKSTWRFVLLACASALVFLVCTVIGGVYGDASTIGGIGFFVALLSLVGVVVGIVGAVVSFVRTALRRHSPPARPVV